MRKTIKKRRYGGRSFGKGAHGEAFNVGDDQDDPTFYSNLRSKSIRSIQIFSPEGEKTHITEQEKEQFIQYIRITRDKIAKVFLPCKTIEADFLEEISKNRKIIDIYGEYAEQYTTITPLPPVFRQYILGCIVTFEDNEKTYAVFNTKCNNRYVITDLKKFALDLIESIIILQSQSYEHNDIKLDNIVKCGEDYKLIDWGQSSTVLNPQKKVGSLLSTNPIRWYILGHSHLNSKYRMQFQTVRKNWRFSRSKLFTDTYARIIREYNELTDKINDRNILAKKYTYTFDIFMLGMTMLHAIFKFGLEIDRFMPLINRFTSLTNPVKNAFEAKELILAV
jgi:hypothetical protein